MRLLSILSLILLSPSLFAQITVGLSAKATEFLSYEPVKLTVAISNQTGADLTLKNTNGNSWVEFVVKNQSNRVVHKVRHSTYSGATIPTAQRIKSTFILNNDYDVAQPGNYSVYAVVRTPNQTASQGTRSDTLYFTVNRGVPNWRTKVGVPGVAGDEREYRIIKHSGSGTPSIYVQVEDLRRGNVLATYSMGNILSFRKALKSIDRSNNLHVLFLTTPEIYCHTVVSTSGETIKRRYFKSHGSTHPGLLTSRDGTVTVINAVIYNAAKERKEQEKFHKLSEMPDGVGQ